MAVSPPTLDCNYLLDSVSAAYVACNFVAATQPVENSGPKSQLLKPVLAAISCGKRESDPKTGGLGAVSHEVDTWCRSGTEMAQGAGVGVRLRSEPDSELLADRLYHRPDA